MSLEARTAGINGEAIPRTQTCLQQTATRIIFSGS